MANIVAEMNLNRPGAFFFCLFIDSQSLTATSVFRSIACHLLDALEDNEEMWDRIIETYGAKAPVLCSAEQILNILLKYLPNGREYVVILGGLEDCHDD